MEAVNSKGLAPLKRLSAECERLRYTIKEHDWQPMYLDATPLPGFSWISIGADQQGAWSSYWMKVDRGARSPVHEHSTTELILILKGVLTDDDGAEFKVGEVVIYAAGSSHATYSKDGCTVLVVAQQGSSVV